MRENLIEASLVSDTSDGLGDHTEKLLSSIGVTKEKYVEIKEKFGLPPTCGCDARKRWLNDVGKYVGIGA